MEVLRVVEPEGRVLPRDERLVMWVWAEDHMSLSVRGDFVFLEREVGCAGVRSASISIASSGGAGGGRRWGEAVISSAFRVEAVLSACAGGEGSVCSEGEAMVIGLYCRCDGGKSCMIRRASEGNTTRRIVREGKRRSWLVVV